MNTNHQSTFRPRARLLSLLGEQLISDQAVGLIELVKNAYDADATSVEVEISGLATPATTQILVRDNGSGMSRDDIEQKWLSPAIDHKEQLKKANKRSKRNRLPIGEKGVGRFAVHQLGHQFKMVSRMDRSAEVVLEIDWDLFDSGDTFLDDVPVTLYEREPQVFTGNQTGTILIASQGRTAWTESHIKKIYRAFRRLQSPNRTLSDFNIVLHCPEYPAYENLGTTDILENAHYIFRGSINDQGMLDYEYRCQHPALNERVINIDDTNLLQIASKEMATNNGSSSGPFFINFYVWDRTQEYMVRSGVSRDDLDAMAGVSLFRDRLRVLPYGEPGNDWLDLDRDRINDPSKRIGNQQIIGFVEVDQETTPALRDKTNREGLIDNEAFRDLRALIRAAMTVFTSHWQQDRPDQEKRTSAPKSDLKVARELAESINSTANPNILVSVPESGRNRLQTPQKDHPQPPSPIPDQITQPEAIGILISTIEEAQKYEKHFKISLEEREMILMHLAATGMAAERVAHEFGRQVHSALEALKSLKPLGRGDSEVARAVQTLDACLGTLRNEFRVLAPYETSWRKQRSAATSIEDSIRLAFDLNRQLLDEAGIRIIVQGDDFSVNTRPASLVQIFDNLIHNACTWLESWSGPRRITAVMNARDRLVIIADSGPGIPEHMYTTIFDQFVTQKSGGRGLGLYITQQLLKDMKARISAGKPAGTGTGAEFTIQFSEA